MKYGIMTVITLFICLTVNGQSNDTFSKKLKSINADASSVSIIVDGEEHKFEGDEAKKLLKHLKMISLMSFEDEECGILITEDDDVDIEIMKFDDDDHAVIMKDLGEEGFFEEILIEEDENGKKVTIKKVDNGEESKTVLKGEEAEKYLEEMKMSEEIVDLDADNFKRMIKLNKCSKTGSKCVKRIKVNLEDKAEKNVKKIIKKKIKQEKENED